MINVNKIRNDYGWIENALTEMFTWIHKPSVKKQLKFYIPLQTLLEF